MNFEQQVLADLSVLKTQMCSLVGNGQPGRIRMLEEKVELHEALAQRGKAIVILLIPAVGLLHLILHLAGRH